MSITGPSPCPRAGNGFLYSAEGLATIAKCLGPTGVLLVWSGFESWDFIDVAEAAGFTIACKPVFFDDLPNVTYYVFIISQQPFTDAEVALIELGLPSTV